VGGLRLVYSESRQSAVLSEGRPGASGLLRASQMDL